MNRQMVGNYCINSTLMCCDDTYVYTCYARGTKNESYPGYFQRGCGTTVEETDMMPVFDFIEKIIAITYFYIRVPTGGIFIEIILTCLGTALLLQHWMPVTADRSLQCSKTYSMLWAVVATAATFVLVIVPVHTFSIVTGYRKGYILTASLAVILVYIPAVWSSLWL